MDVLTALDQHLWLLCIAALALGLTVGSFLNVVISRLPIMIEREERRHCNALLETGAEEHAEPFNLARPGSRCPHCRHAISPRENIPVLSYLLLRGRCSHCNAALSLRYPAVEALSGALALGLALHYGSAGAALAGALCLTWALIALVALDIKHMLLPDDITLPLLWLGLLFNLNGTFAPLHEAVAGAAVGYLSLWTVYWLFRLATGREGMGGGDFKLLAALGAWVGWKLLPLIILLSSLAGAALGGLMLYLQRRDMAAPIPFGPYLAAAGWVALIWGEPLLSWYLGGP